MKTRHPAIPYVAPFIIFLVFLGLAPYLAFLGRWEFPIRVCLLAISIWYFSRDVIDWRVRQPLGTIGIGIVVFLIWIGPDALIPGYRNHWLFQNAITGKDEEPAVQTPGELPPPPAHDPAVAPVPREHDTV